MVSETGADGAVADVTDAVAGAWAGTGAVGNVCCARSPLLTERHSNTPVSETVLLVLKFFSRRFIRRHPFGKGCEGYAEAVEANQKAHCEGCPGYTIHGLVEDLRMPSSSKSIESISKSMGASWFKRKVLPKHLHLLNQSAVQVNRSRLHLSIY